MDQRDNRFYRQPNSAAMSGAEHYRQAEELAQTAQRHITEHPADMRISEVTAYTAQVHATLALAAAQAGELVHRMCGDSARVTDWGDAIGWDTVPDAKAFRDRIVAALGAGRVVDPLDVTDWQRGYRACWERIRPLLDPTGDLLREVLDEEVPF